MSAMIFSSSFCEMSPGSGIASNPVLHTDEYDINVSLVMVPASQRFASTESSSTGSISPL